jgi:cation diffusion facilitator family transporter
MAGCCEDKSCATEQLARRQGRTLKAVLGINLGMFGVEFTAGLLAGSVALVADSMDMLGDAFVYALSLYAVSRGALWKARAALAKGAIMGAFGFFVLGQAAHKALVPVAPEPVTMGVVGLAALVANAVCLWLLWRHRDDDVNMRSVWVCSRNDIVANVSVLGAAALVAATASPWPDIVVGVALAALWLRSSASVVRESRQALALG